MVQYVSNFPLALHCLLFYELQRILLNLNKTAIQINKSNILWKAVVSQRLSGR